ncbi:NYN domain-containing protein [Irpex rosettiformis]|uniref:NYN domain-containing protein n=1 Tax=Irpex rosettiformis TaxID=378272 RepID=A0ACB8TUB1_9APHY|nr:NYN domain-containing protein [Irpex rosettiformis]
MDSCKWPAIRPPRTHCPRRTSLAAHTLHFLLDMSASGLPSCYFIRAAHFRQLWLNLSWSGRGDFSLSQAAQATRDDVCAYVYHRFCVFFRLCSTFFIVATYIGDVESCQTTRIVRDWLCTSVTRCSHRCCFLICHSSTLTLIYTRLPARGCDPAIRTGLSPVKYKYGQPSTILLSTTSSTHLFLFTMESLIERDTNTVAVFWDYENCEIPAATDGFIVANGIRRIAHNYGSVKAFRAYSAMPEVSSLRTAAIRSDLQACGVSIIDSPHNGRKDTADKMMMVDMLAFANDNASPATIVLISGDGDFLYAVSTLRLRKYDVILLAPSQCSHLGLKAQATAVYDWPRDVLSAELPLPSSTVMTGRYGDSNRAGPTYAAAANSRAVSQPNTPQAITPTRLPTTRPRASSASLQQHTRSSSMPVAPQTTVIATYGLPLSRIQASQGGVLPDVVQRPARMELPPPPSGRNNDRPQPSPWRQPRAIMPTSGSTNNESLSPLAPSINVEMPHDLASYEEEIEERDSEDSSHDDGSQSSTSRGNTPVSGAYLTPAEDSLTQMWNHPPMQLPTPPTQDGEQLLDDSTSSLESDETLRPEEEVPLGYHWELVPDGITVPSVEMYRTRKVFPYYFESLVNVLEEERLRGNTRMISSQLGGKLKQADAKVYIKAGVTKLSEFIRLSKDRGFIITGDLGGSMASNGNVWVALHPSYHGKPAPPPGLMPTASTSYTQLV